LLLFINNKIKKQPLPFSK